MDDKSNVKKAAKVVPKTEPVEESKDETVDKELLMKLKILQSTDPFGKRPKIEKKGCSITSNLLGSCSLAVDKDETVDKELLMKLKTLQSTDPFGRRPKIEKKEIQTQVAFGQGGSSYARSFPRRHYLAAILDEEKFGESCASIAQDGKITAAEELGLMDRSDTPHLLLFQLPSSLPLPKQSQSVEEPNTASEENAEPVGTTSKVTREQARSSLFQGSKIKDLPEGLMGKILVYKSGEVKMKIGDALFDVSPGSNCIFVQEVAAINTREKHCCTLGEISKW